MDKNPNVELAHAKAQQHGKFHCQSRWHLENDKDCRFANIYGVSSYLRNLAHGGPRS